MPNSTPHLIIIGPNHTKIDSDIVTPCSISVVLENGHSYDIDHIIQLLETEDARKFKAKNPGRAKRFVRAFKTAVKESIADEDMATHTKS